MKTLVILNDPPYGSERTYNGLRLAAALGRREGVDLRVFLMGDAAPGARKGQKVPQGYYNVQTMIAAILGRKASVGVCGICMDARGIAEAEIVEGAHRSSMEELAAWTSEADKVIVF